MKILILDEEFPFPLNTGKRIRTFNLVARLAKKHQVYYLAYGIKGSVGIKALTQAGITPLAVERQIPPKSGVLFYFRLLLNLFSRYPYIVSSHYSSLFADKLSDCLKQIRFDIVIAEWTPYAVYLNEVKEARKVIVAHNLEHRIWERYFRNESNLLKKWYIGKQLKKVRRFEIESFASVDAVTAVSPIEAEEIVRYGKDLTVEVIPNGVDLDYFSSEDEETASSSMIFVGSMNWRPNQDAVAYFADDVFPRIRAERPGANVYVVGRNPPIQIRELGLRDGITVTGTVDDVRPYIERAGVYIVPLRIGGGSRLKILEAMAMSKVVVSTSVGAEGLEVIDGEHLLIRDGSEALARQILECMANLPTYESLGGRGRRLVEQRYRWEELGRRYNEYLQTILKRA